MDCACQEKAEQGVDSINKRASHKVNAFFLRVFVKLTLTFAHGFCTRWAIPVRITFLFYALYLANSAGSLAIAMQVYRLKPIPSINKTMAFSLPTNPKAIE